MQQRNEFKDSETLEKWERLKSWTPEALLTSQKVYHWECYKEVTNKSKIKRTKDRFDKEKPPNEEASEPTPNTNTTNCYVPIERRK